MKKTSQLLLLAAAFFLVTSPAYANMGAPMIFLTLPGLLIGLVPIIAIEALILQRKLRLSVKQAVKTSSLANLISTLIGIPITWLVLVLIQMVTGGGAAHGISTPLQKFLVVTWQAPWLIPYESEFYWMLPSATAVLLVPFFFASWFVEYIITKKLLKEILKEQLKKAVLIANLVTYALLELLVMFRLVSSVIHHSK